MVYKFFHKNSASGSGVINNVIKQNLQLAEELHTPIIRNFKKWTVYSEFKDDIWGAHLSNMKLIRKLNKRLRFLLALLIFLVNMPGLFLRIKKKGISIVNAFPKILND